MMKKLTIIITIMATAGISYGQGFDKIDKSVLDAAYYPAKAAKRVFAKTDEARKEKEPKIRVLYSRPLKKGRDIFGGLVKFDKPWRVGANESAEILFMTDVEFGGKKIKAGRYSIIIIPTATEWTIKLNTALDGWGQYSYDEAKNISSITVSTQKSGKEIEALSISLYEKSAGTVHLKIGWDNTIAEFPITLKK